MVLSWARSTFNKVWHRPNVCFVQGFAYLTATIVVAIAIGVALSASSWSKRSLTNASPQGSAFWGARATTPGQVVYFPVTVQNNGAQPVVLLSATLLPVPGFATPKLVHLVVLDEHEELVTSSLGWPISSTGCHLPDGGCIGKGKLYKSRPLRGFVVLPHGRHGPGPFPDMIEYGVVGSRLGRYGVAGILLTYRVGEAVLAVRLLDGGLDVVATSDAVSYSTEGFGPAFERVLDGS